MVCWHGIQWLYNGGDCTHSTMPANRKGASKINLLAYACRFTVVQELRLVQPEEDSIVTLSALLDIADLDANYSMKDLFGSIQIQTTRK